MPEQLAAGFGRKVFSFDEGIAGNGGSECFAPAESFFHRLKCLSVASNSTPKSA